MLLGPASGAVTRPGRTCNVNAPAPYIDQGAGMSHHYAGPDFSFPHGDAHLNLSDLLAFPKPGDASTTVLIMDAHPSVGVNPLGRPRTSPARPRRSMS
jgi:hypothetical protein